MEFLKPYSRTAFVALSMLLIGSSAFVFLWKDLNYTGGEKSGEVNGKLVLSFKDVKRKSASSFLWDRTENGESLYEKDTVLVGPESRAEIEMKNGDKLEIAENSLIRLESAKNLAASFIRGSGILRSETGDKIIRVNEEGVVSVEALHARLSTPKALEKVYVDIGKNAEVLFDATLKGKNEEDKEVELVVSSSLKFTEENSHKVDFEPKTTHMNLSKGVYYWRLEADNKPISETRKFEVLEAEAFSLIAPSNGETIRSFETPQFVSFRWLLNESLLDSSITHELLVSDSDKFDASLIKQKVKMSQGESIVSIPNFGSYFWRVDSHFPNKLVQSSEVRSFKVDAIENVAIQLNAPKKESMFSVGSQVVFDWNKLDAKVEYVLEMEDLNRKEEKQTIKSQTHSTNWIGQKDGAYRWHVVGYLKDKKVGESEWSTLSVFDGKPITLGAPKAQERIEFWKVEKKFDFTWDKDSAIEREGRIYLLEVSTDRTFSSKVLQHKSMENAVNSSELSLPQGNIFWRVKLVDEKDAVLKQSEPSQFYYGSPPVLEAPAAIFPATDLVWDMALEGKNLRAEWKAVENATGYEVTIEKQDGFKRTIKTDKPEVELQGVKSGKYQWTVRAIDPLGRKGELMDPKKIVIARGKLPAPDMITPKVEE